MPVLHPPKAVAVDTDEVKVSSPWGSRGYVTVDHPPPAAKPTSSSRRLAAHHALSTSLLGGDLGILRDTLLPSFALHSGLSAIAYVAGRLSDRVEAKDMLWPAAQVANAWWAAIGSQVISDNIPAGTALRSLNRPRRLVLSGVTIWGARLFCRLVHRSLKRPGSDSDDPRYEALKKQEPRGWTVFWNKALWALFLPEVFFQTVIGLPFTVPFSRPLGGVTLKASSMCHSIGQAVAVGLFSAGLALEVLADWQLDGFKESGEEWNKRTMCREGVWGLVRHPNYLGDALVHLSFPLLLYASDMLTPIVLLGPLANYIFLRFYRGDKENEGNQAKRYGIEDVSKKVDFDRYRKELNAFWPGTNQVSNKWAWIVVGCGVAGAVVEKVIQEFL
ncbi:hypothetical protein B0H63DRAFT_388387 [Podospora didyma]|uniref:Steroid 5-alpha reductase C-terminal domain-containing protein n=1 Tax=Podospora didyma TaxID=330526 RepID=A0AAE0NYF3_9PEZI|nr:hypothetical protein B0H63DRAFT_388387 [Podospora didyma]